MSIIIPVTGSTSVNPSSLDSTNSVYESATNIDRGYTDVSSTNYAQFYLTTGIGSETWIYYVFSSPNIPSGATITSISCQVKASISNISALGTKQMQMYTGTTAKGTAVQFTSTSVDTFTLDQSVSNWTISQLNNARIVIKASRSNVQPSTSYYIRFYGATLTINYTVNETGYAVTAQSTIPNTKGVIVSPEYQAIFASDTSTLQDITITNKDGLNLTLSDNGTKIASFTNTSYTYSIASLTTDHAIKIDAAATNFSKINNQWRSIAGVYQKSSGAWTATTFASAFPSGTMIKQGDDIGNDAPLVKFLSNCDVVYCAYRADDESSSSVFQTFRWQSGQSQQDAGATYYLLSCTNSCLGLHKVVIPELDDTVNIPIITTILEYGTYSKLYMNSMDRRVNFYISGDGTSTYYSICNGTLITLKLKTNIIQSASELESLITSATDGGIKASYGKNDYTYTYLYNNSSTVASLLPCYILTIEGNRFGLASVDSNITITPILGFYNSVSNSMSNRSIISNYNSNIYYCGQTGALINARANSYGGGSFFYL